MENLDKSSPSDFGTPYNDIGYLGEGIKSDAQEGIGCIILYGLIITSPIWVSFIIHLI